MTNNKKTLLIFLGSLGTLVLLATLVGFTRFNTKKDETNNTIPDTTSSVLNMTYVVEGESFVLENGRAEKEIMNSSSKHIVSIFGEPVYGDLDLDGDLDASVWLTSEGGGSGTFYYAVLAIKNSDGYKATNAMLLGDRIAPQTLEIQEGRAVYNFAERKATDPMSATPSVARSIWIHFDAKAGEIGEWVKDFEGEANPDVMKLDMKKWVWQSAVIDGKDVKPKDPARFTVEFKKDGTFSASTDCNGIGGNYVIKKDAISFSDMMGTLMYCEGSQENVFRGIFEDASSYSFTSKGELVIALKTKNGKAVFR